MILEIEDNIGNTICAIHIMKDMNGFPDIVNSIGDVSFADVDFDDIFNTNEEKIRICLERVNQKNSNKSFEHSIW